MKSPSLPDAPSVRVLAQAHPFHTVGNELGFPLGSAAGSPDAAYGPRAGFDDQLDRGSEHPGQQESSGLFFRHLSPALTKPDLRYRASDNQSVMGRAADAASRILLTREPSGKRRFNTTYFLRLATSVAADSASRTYRARSKTAPLSDFGSTVGNDAGMNLLHEFGPGLQQAVSSHLPKFVSRIQERVFR